MSDAYSGLETAVSGYTNIGSGVELTHDMISQLIEVDSRYAQAIEYQNGRLQLNKEKYDEAYIKEMLLKLSELGAKISVLTGVSFEEGTTGVMGYDKAKDEFYYYKNKLIPKNFHGTGDVFASTTVGAMMNGFDWKQALKIAADYTAECIRVTMEDPNGCWYGVNFEAAIPYLLQSIGKVIFP